LQKQRCKKNSWTDQIFENVHEINKKADLEPDTIRISIDTKATINMGLYSRGGRSRCIKPVEALDHDMMLKEKLVPGGILEPATAKAFLFFTESNKTSDFMVDGIEDWWRISKGEFNSVRKIVINCDNGPEASGQTGKFLERMVEFSDKTGLEIHLAYYPPYHSKYNSIEHYWGGLEQSWNGYILDSAETIVKRASNFIWRSLKPTVTLFKKVYEKGIRLCRKKRAAIEKRLLRNDKLPKWDIIIKPLQVF
jgi:hypothetical protein